VCAQEAEDSLSRKRYGGLFLGTTQRKSKKREKIYQDDAKKASGFFCICFVIACRIVNPDRDHFRNQGKPLCEEGAVPAIL
jgi:hypothetical protein